MRALGRFAHRIRQDDHRPRGLWANRAGTAVIEFALVCPVLLLLLLGALSYGWYFYTVHTLQQITGDVARAALPGLTASERLSLAQSQLTADLQGAHQINTAQLALAVTSTANDVTVTLTYNLTNNPFSGFSQIVPLPAQTVICSAIIKVGGF